MLRYWLVALLPVLIISGSGPAEAAMPNAVFLQLLSDAQKAEKSGNCETALQLVSVALTRSGDLNNDSQSAAYETGADCAVQLDKIDVAYNYALVGTDLAQASDWLWRLRLQLELNARQPEAALATVETMADRRNAALNGAPVEWLFILNRQLRREKAETSRRLLLQIVTAPAYQPDSVVFNVDFFREDYAELLLEEGDKATAFNVAAQITDPLILVRLSLDPRLRDMVSPTFDPRAAMEHRLKRMQDIAGLHPGSLELIIEIAERQRALGNAIGALATLRNANPIGEHAVKYSDLDAQLNWWWDGIGRTQQALGHYQEAVSAYRAGAALREGGDLNVSQSINLAQAQLRLGHAADALATLAIFNAPGMHMAPYGEMEMRFARGCALSIVGKVADAQADIAFSTAHDSDDQHVLSDLLLCAGDLDGAARAFQARLADPSRRIEALLELSDYPAPDATLPPDPVYGRLQALKARADIQAAIARAGGIRRFNIPREEL